MTFNPEERVSALRLIQLFDPNDLPLAHILPTENLRDVFSRTLVTEYEQFYDDTTDIAKFELAFGTDQEFAVQLPGLGGMEVVFGGPSAPAITAGAEYGPDSRSVTLGGSIRLRFPRDWLRPVTQVDNEWVADPSREFVELDFGGGITVDQDFEFTFEGTNEFTVEPAMIGDTGFVIEGTLAVDLSESSTIPASSGMGLNPTWRGVVFEITRSAPPAGPQRPRSSLGSPTGEFPHRRWRHHRHNRRELGFRTGGRVVRHGIRTPIDRRGVP